MGKDASGQPLIRPEQVSVKKDDSSDEIQEYGVNTRPWIVTVPTDENAESPSITYDLRPDGIDSAPQVTSVSLNPDSNVQRVTLIGKSDEGKTTTIPDLEVTPAGQIASFAPLQASILTIVFTQPSDASIKQYSVSPNVQGCFRAETTTIVTPTTTTAGTTTPSTTTVSTVSTTGTVVTTTTPTVTTTLSTTAPPTVGTTQVTTAVVTTTTTATGTTTVVCPLTGEMPKQAPDYRDEQFTPVVGGGTPTEVRPGVVGWTPKYAPEAPPVLEIDLAPIKDTPSSPLLQSVTVTDLVATTVTVTAKDQTGKVVFEITVNFPTSGVVTVYLRPDDKLPIVAYVVVIELGEPKNPTDTTYDTTITLVGCFEPLAGK